MTEFRYDPKSLRADEFINDAEILDSIAYADAHKDDIELCRRILDSVCLYKNLPWCFPPFFCVVFIR